MNALHPRNVAAAAVDRVVDATRLPITVAERVLGEEAGATWPPVQLVNALDAAILSAAARALDSPRLAARAGFLREAASRAASANLLRLAAEERREAADEQFERKRAEATKRRAAAAEQAEEERERVRAAAEAEAEVAGNRAARREQVLSTKQRQRAKAVAKKEQEAERTRIAAERRALKAEKQAAAAHGRAVALDDAVGAARARRKASR